MKITFFGAARTTTGSMHLLEANGQRVLLECGLFQGKRKEAFERNRNLPFEAASLDAVVLSHAHIDHSGNLPTLARRGLRCPVHATPATTDLCNIMLQDSAHLQAHDVEYVNEERRREGKNEFEPLYEPRDVDALMKHFRALAYETAREIAQGVTIKFNDAGHILGSAVVEINVRENGAARRVLFTGDLGRKGMPILRDPVAVQGADTLITESTYGDRVHEANVDVKERLRGLISEISARGSKLIVPSFAVGRTQQLLYFLDELYTAGAVADVPVYVDSPLATKATAVYEKHAEVYDSEALARLEASKSPFAFARLKQITKVEESKALNHAQGPIVIISPSGMCEGGRIVHHLMHGIGDERNIVLFVGYQAENTLGRYITDGRKRVRILGQEMDVAARVEKIDALSGHADKNELADYFQSLGPGIQRAYVVHGEIKGAQAVAAELKTLGIAKVEVPEPGEQAEV